MSLFEVVHVMRWIELSISFVLFWSLVYYMVNYWVRGYQERQLTLSVLLMITLENIFVSIDAIATRAPVSGKSFVILPTTILTALLVRKFYKYSRAARKVGSDVNEF